eukprot:CAMPEP_0119519782 /NCGR_PEP_ID=MMETSP1344-20130328/35978_1 /TAXON_ID=236787 /ORGANISM="Florenciella parvula, Strain CCMP2471" /LENGTH=64 /DNA_ID=CAMNT_0007557595 /DNA_START=334 /DNA_END=524 /DNA_ORIENTATION=-
MRRSALPSVPEGSFTTADADATGTFGGVSGARADSSACGNGGGVRVATHLATRCADHLAGGWQL